MAGEVEKRLDTLEKRVTANVTDQNRVNEKTAAKIESVAGILDKVLQRVVNIKDYGADIAALQRRADKIESHITSMETSLNKINAAAHDRIVGLERKFVKLDKTSVKLTKATDKRTTERSITEVVDKALAAFDKAHKK